MAVVKPDEIKMAVDGGPFTSYPLGKSAAVWDHIRLWCREHPDKSAMIATHEGAFVIMYRPFPQECAGTDHTWSPWHRVREGRGRECDKCGKREIARASGTPVPEP